MDWVEIYLMLIADSINKMKKFILLGISFLICVPAFAANRYVIGAGGNFSSTATWSTSSGGSGGASVPTFTDAAIADGNSGQLTLDATESVASLTFTGYTNTFTHGNFILNAYGNVTFVSGMTYTPTSSSTITFQSSATLTTGTKLMPSIVVGGSSVLTLGDNLSFTALKTNTLTISTSGSLNLGGFTLSGNSTTNRIFIFSSVPGTGGPITVASGTFANADFQDIAFSSASNVDLHAITGLSGNAGNNTISGGGTLTLTSGTTLYWHVGTGNWSTSGQWFLATNGGGGSGRVPLPQDNTVFDANSFTALGQIVTVDMPRIGSNSTWTGVTNTPELTNSVSVEQFGSLTLSSNILSGANYFGIWTFGGRSNSTITSAGIPFGLGITEIMPGATLTLQDTLEQPFNLQLNWGTFSTNNQTVYAGGIITTYNSILSGTRTLNLGSSTVNLMGTGTVWNAAVTTSLTFSAGTSQINIINSGSATKLFAGGGLTYNNVTIGPSSIGTVSITGANTFNTLVANGPLTISFPGSTTQTVTSFAANGSPNATVNIVSSSPGTTATMSDASGTDYLVYGSIQDITATGGATWYALTMSNISNNSGITFTVLNNYCYQLNTGTWYQVNPLGDSITARFAWVDELVIGNQTNSGRNVASYSYVGSNGASSGNTRYTTASGYSGSDSTNILPLISNVIAAFTTIGSRIVLMQIGTNDAGHGISIATFISDMQSMWASIYASDPTTRILVALPLPLENGGVVDNTNPTYAYDAALLLAIKTEQASYPSMVSVDFYDSIQVGDTSWFTDRMMTDGIHPNLVGGTVLANQWLSCMQSSSNNYCNIASFPSSNGK